MDDVEFAVYLDKRKAAALKKVLQGEGVQTSLEQIFQERTENYYEQIVPDDVRKEIENTIRQERAAAEKEAAASRRFVAIRVVENGQRHHFEQEGYLDPIFIAQQCRYYMQKGNDIAEPSFTILLKGDVPICEDDFYSHMDSIGKSQNVTAVCDINFDDSTFSFMRVEEQMRVYPMKVVSTAAYHAFRKAISTPAERVSTFEDYLDGKEIAMDNQAPIEEMTMQ